MGGGGLCMNEKQIGLQKGIYKANCLNGMYE